MSVIKMLGTFSVVVIFVFLLACKIISKLTLGRCTSPVCLIGKTALITGGNSGIGYETALQLAGRGCRVIIADKDNCEKSKENIIKETDNKNIVAMEFDLASLSSVRKLAQDIIQTEERLDILINNAGTLDFGSTYSEDGLQSQMQVNHFGSFLLTHLLVDLLKKSAPSRIIFVSSIAAFFHNLTAEYLNVRPRQSKIFEIVYCNSKLCNVITARGFAKKLKESGVTSNSLYPGLVNTPMFFKYANQMSSKVSIEYAIEYLKMQWFKFIAKNPLEGAQTTIHLAVAKEVEKVTGKYFVDCRTFYTPPKAKDVDFANKIWKLSEQYVKLSDNEKL